MGMNEFILSCREYSQGQEKYSKFFEDVLSGNYGFDKELLLQAFLFFNIEKYFPSCKELLLFEQSPDILGNTHLGKCDFIYLTDEYSFFLIETKYIDTEATGDTARKRRNKQRNKVIDQVIELRNKLNQYWDIPIKQLNCGVFTTDARLNERSFCYYYDVLTESFSRVDLNTKSVSIVDLEQWLARENESDSNSEFTSEDLWYISDSCEFCFNPELCEKWHVCWFDLQGE